MENVPIGLLVINPEGEIIKVNEMACRLLGYPVSCLEEKGWGELFFEDQKNDDFNQIIVDVIMKREVNLRSLVVYHSPGGDVRHLSVTSSFLHEEGELVGIVVLLDDVTEVIMGQRREKAMLEEKNRIQKERAAALRNLALGVAHEIRNPTMVIGGFARRLQKKAAADSVEDQALEKIISGAARLENIVRSVKEYAGIPGLDLQPAYLNELIEAAVNLNRAKDLALRKEVEFKIVVDSVRVVVDVKLLISALDEIFENSLDFLGRTGGVVTIATRVNELGSTIEISDNGPGIKERDLPFIFDPFFSTRADGMGLGLSKVHLIISEHGGKITVDSREGAGATFSLFLPERREKTSPA
ncbi:MAG: ATP-binding protein [Pseudomonadota bacterium]